MTLYNHFGKLSQLEEEIRKLFVSRGEHLNSQNLIFEVHTSLLLPVLNLWDQEGVIWDLKLKDV